MGNHFTSLSLPDVSLKFLVPEHEFLNNDPGTWPYKIVLGCRACRPVKQQIRTRELDLWTEDFPRAWRITQHWGITYRYSSTFIITSGYHAFHHFLNNSKGREDESLNKSLHPIVYHVDLPCITVWFASCWARARTAWRCSGVNWFNWDPRSLMVMLQFIARRRELDLCVKLKDVMTRSSLHKNSLERHTWRGNRGIGRAERQRCGRLSVFGSHFSHIGELWAIWCFAVQLWYGTIPTIYPIIAAASPLGIVVLHVLVLILFFFKQQQRE